MARAGREWNFLYLKAFDEPDPTLRASAIQEAVKVIATRLCKLSRNHSIEHRNLYLALNDLHVLRTAFVCERAANRTE